MFTGIPAAARATYTLPRYGSFFWGGVASLGQSPTVTQLPEVLAVVAVIALAGIALLIGLVRGRGGKTKSSPAATSSSGVNRGSGAGGEDSLAGPAGTTLIDTLEPDVIEVPSHAPSIEHPESATGRLQRLRARLARSNTALGKGLCKLLPRCGLAAHA